MPKIKARSVPETFRRAGITFTRNEAVYDVDDKTLKALQKEPMLVVTVIPENKKGPDTGKGAAGSDEGQKDAGKGKDPSGAKEK